MAVQLWPSLAPLPPSPRSVLLCIPPPALLPVPPQAPLPAVPLSIQPVLLAILRPMPLAPDLDPLQLLLTPWIQLGKSPCSSDLAWDV